MIQRLWVGLVGVFMVAGCATGDGATTSLPGRGSLKGNAVRTVSVGMPIDVADRWQLVPVGLTLNAQTLTGLVAYTAEVPISPTAVSTSSMAFQMIQQDPWINLIVVDRTDGSRRLLLDERALITRAHTPVEPATFPPDMVRAWWAQNLTQVSEYPVAEYARQLEASDAENALAEAWRDDVVLLGIVIADTNNDNTLGTDDAVVAHALDLTAGTLIPLTPAGQNWTGFTATPATEPRTMTRKEANPGGVFGGSGGGGGGGGGLFGGGGGDDNVTVNVPILRLTLTTQTDADHDGTFTSDRDEQRVHEVTVAESITVVELTPDDLIERALDTAGVGD